MGRLWRSGEPFIWLTGGALALALLMVAGLIGLILYNGLGFFWPAVVEEVRLRDGTTVTGQVVEREAIPGRPGQYRQKFKVANRDLYGSDFRWIDEADIAGRTRPPDVAVIERSEWGLLIGRIAEVRDAGQVVASGPAAWTEMQKRLPEAARARAGHPPHREGRDRRGQPRAGARSGSSCGGSSRRASPKGREVEAIKARLAPLAARYAELERRLAELRASQTASVVVRADGGKEKDLPLAQVVHVYFPNAMGPAAKAAHYVARVWEFVSDDPRESNTEGGVFPAIFGTVMMVMIMSILVTPLGVLAAFYLREYAKQGTFVSAVRIAVNNLAGVPSIVFGVFGVGFFIYFVGGTIDRLFYAEALPTPTYGTGGILWASLTLALLTVPVVIVATEEGLAAVPRGIREASLALSATKLETTLQGRAAGGVAVDPHRAHPGHGAGGRRGGAPHDHGGGQARARPAHRRVLAVPPPRPQVHAPGLPHLRRGLPVAQRGRGPADGVHDHPAPARDRGAPEPLRHRPAQPPPAEVRDLGRLGGLHGWPPSAARRR